MNLKSAPEQLKQKQSNVDSRELFAKELQYQAYRIENVLKVKDPELVGAFVKKHPEYANRPLLQRFFDSYRNEQMNEFVDQAQEKTQSQREQLLEGIRKIIYKAKKERASAKKEITKKQKAEKKEKDKEMARIENLLKKKSFSQKERFDVEKNIARPFDIKEGQLDFKKVRYFYMSVLTGQKAFGGRVQEMQKGYNSAMSQLKDYQKQYTSKKSWKKYAGVVDYGWRKIKGAFSWGKKKMGYKVEKSKKDKINQRIARVRTNYKNQIEQAKRIKTHVFNRSVELKKGLGVFRGDLREKIKKMIMSGEWTEKQQAKAKEAKRILKTKKENLSQGLVKAQQERTSLDETQRGVGRMREGLRNKLSKIRLSGPRLQKKISAVKKRISKLERQYGKDDPRVTAIRKQVLVPLLKGKDNVEQVKEGTAGQLSDTDERLYKLAVLKADLSLKHTDIITQLEKTELQVRYATDRIEKLRKQRHELHEMLEGMETAYVAVDEFKGNVSKNLDKMNTGNKKVMKGLDAQYDYLKQAKATDPGIGTALFNTVIIGDAGLMGGLKQINNVPAYITWAFNGRDWKEAKKWSITGSLGFLQKKYDAWLDKGGFKGNSLWAAPANFVAGIGNTALSLVSGVGMLVFETDKVLDSLEMMVTDLSVFKEVLKGVIHYDDWAEGRGDIAAGKTAGDLIVLFLTAGASAGAQASAKVGATASRVARMAAYTKGFLKEVARKSINLPKNIAKFVISLPRKGVGVVKFIVKSEHALRTRGLKGLREYLFNARYSNGKTAKLDDIQKYVGGMGEKKLKNLNPSTRTAIKKTLSNPDAAKIKKLLKRLDKEFYAGGWKTRNALGPLRSKLNRYIKLDIKHMKGKEFLRQKYGSLDDVANVSKKVGPSDDIITKYKAAKDQLDEAEKIEIPKKSKEVGDDVIRAAEKEKTKAIKEAKKALQEQEQALIKRYETMRVKDGVVNERISVDEAVFRRNRAQAQLDEAKKLPKGTKRKDAIAKAENRLAKETKLYEHVEGSVHDLLRDADDMIVAMADKKPNGFFEKMRMKSRVKDMIRRLKIEEELGINVGKRLARLKDIEKGLKAIERATKTVKTAEKASKVKFSEKLRKVGRLIKTKQGKELMKFIYNNVVAWPVWLHVRKLRNLKDLPRRILGQRGKNVAFEKISKMSAVTTTSKRINGLLKKGRLREAVSLYYAARSNAHALGIPFAAMDKSFIGFLHKVAPGSALYLGRVKDLADPAKIAQLPRHSKIDMDQFNRLQQEHINNMKQYTL